MQFRGFQLKKRGMQQMLHSSDIVMADDTDILEACVLYCDLLHKQIQDEPLCVTLTHDWIFAL